MGPWDSKLRWQPGGNFQPTRLMCEFNWRECPYAIGKYFWSEIYTDVAEFLSNNNEDSLLKGALLFATSIIVYFVIYWKIRKTKEKKVNNFILNKIAFDIQDLELRVDILSYKLQHGRWPSLQQITNIYEIDKTNKDKVRLSVSATDSSNCNKKLWLKNFITNNYLKIKSSCNLFGKSSSNDYDSQSLKDAKILPKICESINFVDQNDDESAEEMQIICNNYLDETDDNESELEKTYSSDSIKEDADIKTLSENDINKKEIENKNEKLLGEYESQENIKNVCEIEENGEVFYNNHDKARAVKEKKEKQKDIKITEHENQNYSKKDKNTLNNLNSSAKLNGTLQIVEKNSAVFSASESKVPELEKHSFNNSKVFSQPEIIFNPPLLNNLLTIDSTFKPTKHEKTANKSLDDVKTRLENLYCALQTYESQQESNSTELSEEEAAKKLLAHTFIQELSDFSIISESETDDKSNINHDKKYSQVINPVQKLNGSVLEISSNDKEDDYENSSVEDDIESCESNQTEKQEITEKYTEDDVIAFDEASRLNECNSLMLKQPLIEVHLENSIISNENLMRTDEPLIELQEDKSSDEESKFTELNQFFINSKSLYQSTLSDIVSESDHIEETDGTDDHDGLNIIFNDRNIDFCHEDNDNLKSKNVWDQMMIDSRVKSMGNCEEVVETEGKDIELLIDSNPLLDKRVSVLFETVSDGYLDEIQIDQSQLDSLKCLEDSFINSENSDALKDDLIDLNDDVVENNINHNANVKDQNCENRERLDTEKSNQQIDDNIQVIENLNRSDTKILEVKSIKKSSGKKNCAEMTRKNYLISSKTFIKENVKKKLDNNLEDKSLKELHSINHSNKHQISPKRCGININDDIEKTFRDINFYGNSNSASILAQKTSAESKEKIIFNDKSDAENSEIILNKLLSKNNCENLSEIEFDVGLEMQEHSKSEYEKNSLLNTLSESSSLYLTGEGSSSDISNNEKIIDLIESTNNTKVNEILFEFNTNEKRESKDNKIKDDDEERATIVSKDSAFYETSQSSVITINNVDVENNNNNNLDRNKSHDNFNCNQCSFEQEPPQNKSQLPKKRSKLGEGKGERAAVKTEESSSISTSRGAIKLLDEKINRFPTHSNVKSNNSLKRDIKGSKQKPTEGYKFNDNLHKSKVSTPNDIKTTVKDVKTNKLSLKAKSHLNLSNDCGQDVKKKGLEGRSKSYITPRKLESNPRCMFNSLPNKKYPKNHGLVDRNLEKNSESSRFNVCEKKSTISRKLDNETKTRSQVSINKSWKSNIPILKSRMELLKDKNTTNNAIKNISIKRSSQFGETENTLSCIENNKTVQNYENNFPSKNCIGLCKKFNQASAECREVCMKEKNTSIKDLEVGRNSEDSLLLQEAKKMIYVNIITNQQDTRTKLIHFEELLDHMKNQDSNNQSICKNNDDLDFGKECNCSELLALISSTLGQENRVVVCQKKEMEVLAKPTVVDTSTSILDITQLFNRNSIPGDNEIISDKCIKFGGDSDQPNNSYNFQEFRSCEEIIQQIQKMEHTSDLDICRMS